MIVDEKKYHEILNAEPDNIDVVCEGGLCPGTGELDNFVIKVSQVTRFNVFTSANLGHCLNAHTNNPLVRKPNYESGNHLAMLSVRLFDVGFNGRGYSGSYQHSIRDGGFVRDFCEGLRIVVDCRVGSGLCVAITEWKGRASLESVSISREILSGVDVTHVGSSLFDLITVPTVVMKAYVRGLEGDYARNHIGNLFDKEDDDE